VPEYAAAAARLAVALSAQEIDPTFYPRPAVVLPYHGPDGQPTGFQRVRYLDPPEVGGLRKKSIRYQQPKGTAPEVYLPPVMGHDWQVTLADPQQPIIITEGEIKSLSVMVNTGIA